MRKFIGYGEELTFPEFVRNFILRPDNGVTKQDIGDLLRENDIDFRSSESKEQLFEKAKKLLGSSEKLAEYFDVCVDGEYYLCGFPFLTKATLKRLEKFEAIKVVSYKEFRAYGDIRYAPRYDLKQYLGMTEAKLKRLIEKYPKGMRLQEDENDPAVIAKKEERKRKREEKKAEDARIKREQNEYIESLKKKIDDTYTRSIQSCKDMLHLLTEQAPCETRDIGTICIDIETTGFSTTYDEILQIAIIDEEGNILMNEHLRPSVKTSWEEAQAINHISPEQISLVGRAPYEVSGELKNILTSAKCIVGYNTSFDLGFIKEFFGITIPGERIYDVMYDFADIYGEYSEKYESFKFQSLDTCTRFFDYEWPGKAHDALEDVKATMYCYKAMQNISPEETESIKERNERIMNGDPFPYS